MRQTRASIGHGDDRQQRHQKQETDAFKACGENGERRRNDAPYTGKRREIAHKRDRLRQQAGNRQTGLGHLRLVHRPIAVASHGRISARRYAYRAARRPKLPAVAPRLV